MNILFINRMMGIAWGGGENFDYNLARGLEQMGHRVRFLTGTRPGQEPRAAGSLALEAVTTPYLRHHMYRWAGRVRVLPGLVAELDLRLFERAALERTGELARRQRFDLVQVLALPRLAAALRGVGFRVAMRFPGPPAWFHTRLLRRLAGDGVAMLAHGDTVGRLERLGVPATAVPPGVDGGVFGQGVSGGGLRRELRQRHGWEEDQLVLTTVGRLVPGKGHAFLIRAMADLARRVPAARLAIVGDGPLRAGLEDLARTAGVQDRIVFAGQQNAAGVAAWLAASDLFCLFSDYENYSNATLEAMAAGLPVLATRIGGFPLQIEEGVNGHLIEPGAAAAFVELAARLAGDRDARRRLSEGARRFAARFSWADSAARAAGVYERLVA